MAVVVLAALVLSAVVADYPVNRTYHEVPTSGNVSLIVSLWLPQTNDTSLRFPVLIFPTSWSLPIIEYYVDDYGLARSGYICMTYCERGWWESTGKIDTGGPGDMSDLNHLVDWVLGHVREADGDNIGMGGISYGGGLSLLGPAMEPRIKAVAAMSGWTSLINALWPAQSPAIIYGEALKLMASVPGVAHPPTGNVSIQRLLDNMMFHHDIDATLEWAHVRSPDAYLDRLNSRPKDLAMYISNNLEDQLFPPQNTLDHFWSKLTIPNKRLDLNQGWHAIPESGKIGKNYVWEKAKMWFDHYLKGIENGIESQPPVNIQLLTEDRKDVVRVPLSQWPDPSSTTEVHYFLGSRGSDDFGSLSQQEPTSNDTKPDSIRFGYGSGLTCGIPALSEIIQELAYVPIYNHLHNYSKAQGLVYLSEAFPSNRMVLGTPKVVVSLKHTRDNMQLNTYLYSVCPTTPLRGLLLSYGTASVWGGKPNTIVQIPVEMFTAAYTIPKGCRMGLGFSLWNELYSEPTFGKSYDIEVHYGATTLSVTYYRD